MRQALPGMLPKAKYINFSLALFLTEYLFLRLCRTNQCLCKIHEISEPPEFLIGHRLAFQFNDKIVSLHFLVPFIPIKNVQGVEVNRS